MWNNTLTFHVKYSTTDFDHALELETDQNESHIQARYKTQL